MWIRPPELWTVRCLPLWQMLHKCYCSLAKDTHLIYLLPDTDPAIIPFISDFHIISDIRDFCIPSLKHGGKKRRPELQGDIESVYTLQEAIRMSISHRSYIQKSITQRALEFLCAFDSSYPKLVLDIGCGTGLSTESATENGHQVVGIDIAMPMLSVASSKRTSSCDYLGANCCLPFPIQPKFFDGVISISFLQWLITVDGSGKILRTFFSSVSNCLKPGGCFVAQFYPRNPEEAQQAVNFASGFFVGVLLACRPCVARGHKLFLVLQKQNKSH